jgi:hypothetical protein
MNITGTNALQVRNRKIHDWPRGRRLAMFEVGSPAGTPVAARVVSQRWRMIEFEILSAYHPQLTTDLTRRHKQQQGRCRERTTTAFLLRSRLRFGGSNS